MYNSREFPPQIDPETSTRISLPNRNGTTVLLGENKPLLIASNLLFWTAGSGYVVVCFWLIKLWYILARCLCVACFGIAQTPNSMRDYYVCFIVSHVFRDWITDLFGWTNVIRINWSKFDRFYSIASIFQEDSPALGRYEFMNRKKNDVFREPHAKICEHKKTLINSISLIWSRNFVWVFCRFDQHWTPVMVAFIYLFNSNNRYF